MAFRYSPLQAHLTLKSAGLAYRNASIGARLSGNAYQSTPTGARLSVRANLAASESNEPNLAVEVERAELVLHEGLDSGFASASGAGSD